MDLLTFAFFSRSKFNGISCFTVLTVIFVASLRPDSIEPFELVEPDTEIIIDFPTPVLLGTIDLVDDANVDSFEVSIIDSEGDQSPFYVSF